MTIGQCGEDLVLNFFNTFEGVRQAWLLGLAAGPMGARAGNGAGLYLTWVVGGVLRGCRVVGGLYGLSSFRCYLKDIVVKVKAFPPKTLKEPLSSGRYT